MSGSGQLDGEHPGALRWCKTSEWYIDAQDTDLRIVKAYIHQNVARYTLVRTSPQLSEPFERWHLGVFATAKAAMQAAERYCAQHPECKTAAARAG